MPATTVQSIYGSVNELYRSRRESKEEREDDAVKEYLSIFLGQGLDTSKGIERILLYDDSK
ncbi:hypothetical protein HYX19_03055 [Candidatus Woesearchaeota archaeon]|nr:hypothetical protein [Candidatus Woesearchaeota archaeon]